MLRMVWGFSVGGLLVWVCVEEVDVLKKWSLSIRDVK